MKKVVAGMDLHSNNVMIGVMDMGGKLLASHHVSGGDGHNIPHAIAAPRRGR